MTLKLALLVTSNIYCINAKLDSKLARCCILNESNKRGGVSLAVCVIWELQDSAGRSH